MKRLFLLYAVCALWAVAGGCTKEMSEGGPAGELALRPMLSGFDGECRSRAAANPFTLADYFGNAAQALVSDNAAPTPNTATYAYSDGKLSWSAGYKFALPASPMYIAYLKVEWPALSAPLILDQSTRDGFLAADRLVWEGTNVVNATTVPFTFKHSRSQLTFIAGGEFTGQPITALSMYAGANSYKAYCGSGDGAAHLIYDTSVAADTRVSVIFGNGNTAINFTLDQIVTLTPNKNYNIYLGGN